MKDKDKDNVPGALRNYVDKFVQQLRGDGLRVSAPVVADRATRALVHYPIMDNIEQTACYKGIAQEAREALRRGNEQQYDASAVSQERLALPEDHILNESYSVCVGKTADGKDDFVYVPRDDLTLAEVEQICGKFDALSEHYARHSRALFADWKRRHPGLGLDDHPPVVQ